MDEDIAIGIDREVRGVLLPHKYRNQGFEKEMTKAPRKDDGMKNAKPDYIYGISARKLPIQSGLSLDNKLYKLFTIAKGIYHPSLLVEGKSDGDSVAQATDQARRGGATLVHAARIIVDFLDFNWEEPDLQHQDPCFSNLPTSTSQQPCQQIDPTPTLDHTQKQQSSRVNILLGPDVHTFVYSAVVSPQVVTFYVHWHEQVRLSGGTVDSPFHINTVASQSVHDERRALDAIRRVLHNICKWGVGERFREHVKAHQAVCVYSQRFQCNQHTAVGLEKKRKLASSDGAAPSTRASVVDNLEFESDGESLSGKCAETCKITLTQKGDGATDQSGETQ